MAKKDTEKKTTKKEVTLEVPEVASEAKSLEVPDDAKIKGVTSVDCYNAGGGFIRTYYLTVHGKKFQELAKMFCSKKGRESYTTKKGSK